MKGPFQRLKHDLRRLWECPVCQHRVHTPGIVTSCLCRCQQQVDPTTRRFMRLLEVTPYVARERVKPIPKETAAVVAVESTTATPPANTTEETT